MKKITDGNFITRGYEYNGFEIRNHGYYPPDKSNWWEAIDIKTGSADFHAHTKREIKQLIDESKL